MRKNDATFDDEERPVDVDMTPDADVSAVVWTPDDDVEAAERGDSLPGEAEADIIADSDDAPAFDADIPNAEVAPTDGEGQSADDDETSDERRSAWKLFSSEDLPQLSLREILGGDYLIGSFLRQNIGFILFLMVLSVGYITNRYLAQQEIIEEERLRKELVEKKNYALTQYVLLTRNSRQSNIEASLREIGDTLLRTSKEPPFIIRAK